MNNEQDAVKFFAASISCAFQDFALMLPVGLMYSFIMSMVIAVFSGTKFTDSGSLFYLGACLVCAMLILLSSWFRLSAEHKTSGPAELAGALLFTIAMSFPLLYIDWRMALAALWVVPVALIPRLYPVLKLGLASAALTGALLFSRDSLSINTFLLFIMTASRLYDPLESALQNHYNYGGDKK